MPPEYLQKLKTILKIFDNSQDDRLQIFIDMVAQRILNYINRTNLPPELHLIVLELAAEAVNGNNLFNDEEADINAVTLAGANIQYGSRSGAKTASIATMIDDRILQRRLELNQFRTIFRQ